MPDSRRVVRFATEAAVIVVSILLAFWIDAWWDSSQARRSEAVVLESIRGEAEQNRIDLDELLERSDAQLARINMFLSATPDELRGLPQDSVLPWLSAMVITWTFDADDSAAGLFLDSSTPVTPEAREVRGVLARWVRIVDDLEEEKSSLWDLGVDLATRLATHLAPTVEGDPGMIHMIAARQGAGLLSRLRDDRVFVAVLLNKAHYQGVYTLELEDASAALDSLRSAARLE
ncbi:MAG TPA: hypothetical protein VK858_04285 [Longimicrobiales bacterium]|nr:hypothetical protein [Longimicrobiales bacterium]